MRSNIDVSRGFGAPLDPRPDRSPGQLLSDDDRHGIGHSGPEHPVTICRGSRNRLTEFSDRSLGRFSTITGVRTPAGEISWGTVVLAAGVWSAAFSDALEFKVPVQALEGERLMLRYTELVTRDEAVGDTLFNTLREHFSDREMVEITFCIGNWNCVSKFALALQLDLEKPRENE